MDLQISLASKAVHIATHYFLIVGGDDGLDLEVTVPEDELREAEAKEYGE